MAHSSSDTIETILLDYVGYANDEMTRAMITVDVNYLIVREKQSDNDNYEKFGIYCDSENNPSPTDNLTLELFICTSDSEYYKIQCVLVGNNVLISVNNEEE